MSGPNLQSERMTAREALPDDACVDANGLPKYLRYPDVSKRLGVKRTEVRRIVERGWLSTTRGKDGWRIYFLREQVEQLAKERYDCRPTRQPGIAGTKVDKRGTGPTGGKVAAKVFALLDDGADLSRVVREARITPEKARILWAEWKTPFEVGAAARRAHEAALVEKEAQREHDKFMHRQAMARASARVARRTLMNPPPVPLEREEDRRGEDEADRGRERSVDRVA